MGIPIVGVEWRKAVAAEGLLSRSQPPQEPWTPPALTLGELCPTPWTTPRTASSSDGCPQEVSIEADDQFDQPVGFAEGLTSDDELSEESLPDRPEFAVEPQSDG